MREVLKYFQEKTQKVKKKMPIFKLCVKFVIIPGSAFGDFSALGSAAVCSALGSGSDSDDGSGSEAGDFEFWLTVAFTNCSDDFCFCRSGKFRHVEFNFLGLHPNPTHDVPLTTATISISFLSFNIRQ